MNKEAKKESATMTTREVAVLIEEFRSQFRALGEELKTVSRRLEAIETNQARAWEKITGIDLRLIRVERDVAVMKSDITEIKELVKDHSQRLTHLEAK
ncbi:MAG: hypothetical protein ACOY3D_06305 [Candidatus Omnitrophota bacterium]